MLKTLKWIINIEVIIKVINIRKNIFKAKIEQS